MPNLISPTQAEGDVGSLAIHDNPGRQRLGDDIRIHNGHRRRIDVQLDTKYEVAAGGSCLVHFGGEDIIPA
ncbi:MAG: hypothetical protein JWM16_2935, partial [Verrucomicrobiales bacterium]|nr:hypothetical protein [Verrucomicrobiales bacterium]